MDKFACRVSFLVPALAVFFGAYHFTVLSTLGAVVAGVAAGVCGGLFWFVVALMNCRMTG